MSDHVFIGHDYFNAWYEDGKLKQSNKPDYLDIETLLSVFPDANAYWMGDDVYEELLNGEDYPASLSDVPLDRMQKIR
ncbi:hypothetical protein PP304_gp191 [Gordonia phage Phendrix]|uniref:Uncharacterized protein n=1 Tax=Gordonia phage Phendrix TaxID=2593335 RepID=A0A514U174_9CAUD|nr:hypothetical protein PP304_gp191 [Gordonia phage Phendrix]QDK02679.1 hypothetical protein SEA_PHENDRIX_162 [Gordonia phage Phendrix]